MNLIKQFVTLSNHETLAYLKAGESKKVLVLIHGNLSSSYHWLPLIESLEAHYTIYAFDLRGMGDSSYHQRFDTLHDLAQDIQLALDALHVTAYVVAGWSAGGGIAMLLAANDRRVEKLILLSSMSYRGLPVYRKDEQGKMIIGATYETKDALAQDPVQVVPLLKAFANQDQAYMDWLWKTLIYKHHLPEPALHQTLILESLKQRNLVDLDWAIMHFNIGAGKTDYAQGTLEIKKIQTPVLSLWGSLDQTVMEFMVRETAFVLGEKCTLKIYPDTGHSPITDNLKTLTQDIQSFIS